MSTPEPMPQSRSQARTIALVTVVIAFIAGLLIGVVGDRLYILRFRDRGAHGSRFMTQRIVAHLDSELHLTSQQHDEITRILEARREHIAAIGATVRPQIRKEIESANAEIEKVLTPEQRDRFAKMRMRMLPRHDHDLAPGSTPPRATLTEPGTAAPPQPAPGSPRP